MLSLCTGLYLRDTDWSRIKRCVYVATGANLGRYGQSDSRNLLQTSRKQDGKTTQFGHDETRIYATQLTGVLGTQASQLLVL